MLLIREFHSDADIQAAFTLMAQLRDRVRQETFLAEVRAQQVGGYRLIGGFQGDTLVALAGIRSSATLSRGPHLFVDDLVVTQGARAGGIGREMIDWLRGETAKLGFERLYLDSRDTARGFYDRCGFTFLTAIPGWIAAAPH